MSFDLIKQWLEELTARQVREHLRPVWFGLVLLPFATLASVIFVYFCLSRFLGGGLATYTHGHAWLQDRNFELTLIVLAGMYGFELVRALVLSRETPPGKSYNQDSQEDLLGPDEGDVQMVNWKLFFWVVLTGPCLFGHCLGWVQDARRVGRRDIHTCATVLWALAQERRAVPHAQFIGGYHGLDFHKALKELREVPGVLFLKEPSPHLALSDDLREAMEAGEPLEIE